MSEKDKLREEIERLRAELETVKLERDEAHREVDAMQSRMNKIAALCEKADEAEWDIAISHFADIFNIAEEAADAIERGEHRKENEE